MKNILKLLLLTSISSFLLSCGGGRSDSASDTFLGGVYSGFLRRISNTCGPNIPPSLSVLWTVNQNGLDIVLDASPSNQTFVGSVTSTESFKVQKREMLSNCVSDSVLDVIEITDTGGLAGLSISVNQCNDGSSCEYVYVGELDRSF